MPSYVLWSLGHWLFDTLVNEGFAASCRALDGQRHLFIGKTCPWRDVREEVVVMGPDRCSSLTTTNYYVQSVATGRFFFTDDVVQPTSTPDPVDPPGEPQAFFAERDGPVPPILDSVRGKTAVPAIRYDVGHPGGGQGL